MLHRVRTSPSPLHVQAGIHRASLGELVQPSSSTKARLKKNMRNPACHLVLRSATIPARSVSQTVQIPAWRCRCFGHSSTAASKQQTAETSSTSSDQDIRDLRIDKVCSCRLHVVALCLSAGVQHVKEEHTALHMHSVSVMQSCTLAQSVAKAPVCLPL